MRGNRTSFDAFAKLAQKLLTLTVLEEGEALVFTTSAPSNIRILSGRSLGALHLNDGKYLRLLIELGLESTDEGRRLKVRQASYQYQTDSEGSEWIFRYDYLRYGAPGRYPPAHMQLRGAFADENCLPSNRPLERVHFPTGRISLEAVIRLLTNEFGISTNTDRAIWDAALKESEGVFQEIAHHPLSIAPSPPESSS